MHRQSLIQNDCLLVASVKKFLLTRKKSPSLLWEHNIRNVLCQPETLTWHGSRLGEVYELQSKYEVFFFSLVHIPPKWQSLVVWIPEVANVTGLIWLSAWIFHEWVYSTNGCIPLLTPSIPLQYLVVVSSTMYIPMISWYKIAYLGKYVFKTLGMLYHLLQTKTRYSNLPTKYFSSSLQVNTPE